MESIQQVISSLNAISSSLQIPELFASEIEQLSKISASGQLSSENYSIINILKSICEQWNPPLTSECRENFEQIMKVLNDVVLQMNSQETENIQFKFEIDNIAKKTKNFIDVAYGNINNKLEFFNGLKKAKSIIPKKDVDLLLNLTVMISDFLNSKEKNFGNLKENIAPSLLFLIATADKVNYKDFQILEKSAIKIMSKKVSEFDIPNLCFDLIHHVYEIMAILNPRNVKKREEIEKLLLESYSNPKSINISEVEYYTHLYSNMETEQSNVFKSITKAIRGCFLGQGSISEINFERGIDILKNTIPEDFKMEETAAEIPEIFTKCPLEVVESKDVPSVSEVTNAHLYYCEKAGLLSFTPSEYEIKVVEQPSPETHYKKIDIVNEINLPKIDKGKVQNYIHVPLVGEMMRSISDSRKQLDLKYTQIGNLFNSKYERHGFSSFPKNNSKVMKYLSFEISDFKIENKTLEFVIAMLYVFDPDKKEAITEPVFFSIQNNEICFHKDAKRIVFEINDSKNLVLICRLFHNQAYDVATFVSSLFDSKRSAKPTQSPYNFAVSGFKIFDDSKGIFINHDSLPQSFHIIEPGKALIIDDALMTVLSQPPDLKINVQSKIKLELLNEKPTSDFCYTWPSGEASTLISSSIEYQPTTLTPIIEINNISFSFKKPQKGKYVWFVAYLVENDNNIIPTQTTPNVISYEASELISKYTSTIVPFDSRCRFPDVVRFHIDKKLKKSANILIHFFVVEPGKPKEMYKISVIPLYDGKLPLRSTQLELPLFKVSNANSVKYLSKLKKISSQSKTFLNIRIPQIYFPHQNFRKLLSSKSSAMLKSIQTLDVPRQMLNDNFLYSVSRLIMTISPQNIQCIVSYLSEFNLDELGPSLNYWIFNNFKPLLVDDLPEKFFRAIFSSLTLLVQVELSAETILYCLQYLISAPYLINIALVIILTYHKKNGMFQNELLNNVSSFIQVFSKFIVRVAVLEKTTEVNQLFSEFLYHIYSLFPENKGLKLIQEHLENISNLQDFNLEPLYPTQTDVKSKHSNLPPPSPIPKPSKTTLSFQNRALHMRYDFIQIFTRTNNFLVSIGYSDPNYIKIFSILISSLTEVSNLDIDFAQKWIITISEFVRTIEKTPNIIAKCADVLIPYFKYAVSVISNEELIGDYQIFQHFIMPILVMLHSPEKINLVSYFTDLSVDEQTQLINFFEKLICKSLITTQLNGSKNNDEMKDLIAKSKEINFTLFNELSIRILEYLYSLIDKVRFDLSVSAAITSLINSLLNIYQSWDNYKTILLIIVKFIDSQPDKFFFELTEPYKQLIQIALNLVKRHLRISRASGVAVLIHYFYVDFLTTNNMLVTKQFFMDLFSEILFDVEKNILPSYKLLIDRLRLFITSFSFSQQFIDMFEERYTAAKIIYDSVVKIRGLNKSPELRINMLSQIADQFFGYPTIRLKWLQKIVDFCNKEKLMLQASISQTKISKLIDVMMRKGQNDFHIKPLDFSFYSCTNEENNVILEHTTEEFRHLLTNNPQFCPTGLIDSINLSIQYAKEAANNLSVRKLYFMLIHIYESQRKFLELSSFVHELSQTYNLLATPVDQSTNEYKKPSLYFYLLERIKNGECFSKEIYTSTISDLNVYASYLNDINTKRFEYLGPAFTASDHDEAMKTTNGICVSSVQPKLTNTLSLETNTFYQDIIKEDQSFKRVIITTDLPLPSSFICVNVNNIEVQTYTEEEAFELFIEESINKLKEGRECILLHCPTVEIKSRWMKNKPSLAIHPCRRSIQEELNSKSNIVKIIFDKFLSKGSVLPKQKELVEKWFNEMIISIQTFKLGSDYENKELYEKEINQMRDTLTRYYKLLFKKGLVFHEIESKTDPLQYVSPYEITEEKNK